MNQRAITLAVVLFVLVVIGMFMFAWLKKSEVNVQEPASVDSATSETVHSYPEITRIEGKHFFNNGIHTVVGEIVFPTPCELLDTNATVAESYPEQVTFVFSVINHAETCAQMQTAQRYKISVAASPEASFKAMFQGREVELNLIEALPGETPEDFELFIKG